MSRVAAEPQRLSAGRRARLIVIIGALSAFGPLSLDMYLPSLPTLQQDLGASASAAQLTLTACLLGLAGGQLIAGPLSDSLGRRLPLMVGLIGYMLTSLLCAFAPSVAVLVALRFLQGACGAAGIVISRATVRDLFAGTELARLFALTMLVNGLAPILAPVIGGQLLLVTTWRGVFVVLGLIGLLLALAGFFGMPESLPPERRRSGGLPDTLATFARLLRDRNLLGYALSAGLALAAMFAYISGSPFVVQEIYGVDPQGFSLIFACNALGIVAAGQISGLLVGRVPPRRLLAIGLTISITGAVLLLLAVLFDVGLVGVLVALFLVVSSVGLIMPNASALALADHPNAAGSASALIGLLQYVLGAVVAPLVGIAGSGTALPMAIIIVLASGGANLAFRLLPRRPAATA